MLRYLKIQNLAVIDETQLDLEPGFICLTGESGAGKSVLVDAFLLLAGTRASAELVRTGCDKAVVEAEFELASQPPELEMLEDTTLYLRREISREGKSRAFVNGALVPNSVLQKYAEPAFEIYGQHGQQRLLKERHHLEWFDVQTNLADQAGAFEDQLAEFRAEFREYWNLKNNEIQRRKEADFTRHQIAEIEKVNPNDEDADLELRLRKARNMDTIRHHAGQVYSLIDRDLGPDLKKLKRALEVLLEFQPELTAYAEQVDGLAATLDDLQADIEGGAYQEDNRDLAKLEARESELNRLFMKYGRNLDEVLAEWANLKQKLNQLRDVTDHLETRWQTVASSYQALRQTRAGLLKARRSASTGFVAGVKSSLKDLSLDHAGFDVQTEAEAWPEELVHQQELSLPPQSLRFVFSANPGEPLRALSKVASGGELSRVMLALVDAARRPTPKLLIFDEIDAGLGGKTAHAVGARLARIGKGHQVLCVTHFAQVARFANSQIKIEKSILKGRTHTRLVVCDFETRVAELARLMGGDAEAENLRDHARQLMTQTQI